MRLIIAARCALGWSQAELAKRAGIARASLSRAEQGTIDSRSSTLHAMEMALEEGGVEFLPETETKGPGIRVPKRNKR